MFLFLKCSCGNKTSGEYLHFKDATNSLPVRETDRSSHALLLKHMRRKSRLESLLPGIVPLPSRTSAPSQTIGEAAATIQGRVWKVETFASLLGYK